MCEAILHRWRTGTTSIKLNIGYTGHERQGTRHADKGLYIAEFGHEMAKLEGKDFEPDEDEYKVAMLASFMTGGPKAVVIIPVVSMVS